jgi:hypothetical protein
MNRTLAGKDEAGNRINESVTKRTPVLRAGTSNAWPGEIRGTQEGKRRSGAASRIEPEIGTRRRACGKNQETDRRTVARSPSTPQQKRYQAGGACGQRIRSTRPSAGLKTEKRRHATEELGTSETETKTRRRRSNFGAGRRACGRNQDCRALAPGEERRQWRRGSGKDSRATATRTLAPPQKIKPNTGRALATSGRPTHEHAKWICSRDENRAGSQGKQL